MSNQYEICQYCEGEIQLVQRAKYGSPDLIWECPQCKANVTAYSHKPTGLAARPDIRKLRHDLYELKTKYKWFSNYLTVVASGKLTKIPDEELQPLLDFFHQVNNEARSKYKTELKELKEEQARLRETEESIRIRLGEVNLLIRATIFEQLPKVVQEKITKKEQEKWEESLRCIKWGHTAREENLTEDEIINKAEKYHYQKKLVDAMFELRPDELWQLNV